jgi:DNA-binding CsgD family transcriptional regulator
MRETRLWTDEELGVIEGNPHLTAREIASLLGRTRSSVLKKRSELRHGISRENGLWSESELDFIALSDDLTAGQIAKHLGRTVASVNHARKRLREIGQLASLLDGGAHRVNPRSVGTRILVAKTCSRCGLLLDASWFGFRAGSDRRGQRLSACRKCLASETKEYTRRTKAPTKFQQKLQAVTLEKATNLGKEWTSSELELIADPNRTNFEKAIILGRSYYGVATRCAKLGLRSRKEELGDPTDDQWIIKLRAEIADRFLVAS